MKELTRKLSAESEGIDISKSWGTTILRRFENPNDHALLNRTQKSFCNVIYKSNRVAGINSRGDFGHAMNILDPMIANSPELLQATNITFVDTIACQS